MVLEVQIGEKMVKEKGLWIAFEGNDGSGKTMMAEAVGDYLEDLGLEVVRTREPGGNEYSEKLRKLIFDNEVAEDGETQLLLFTAARRRNIFKTVLPAALAGKIILSDRSQGSTFAYQHFQFGIPWEMVSRINTFATQGVQPNYTVLLDVSENVGNERMRKAKGYEANHFDKADFVNLTKRRMGYLYLAKELDNWTVINADNDQETVFKDIIKAFRDHKILDAYGL